MFILRVSDASGVVKVEEMHLPKRRPGAAQSYNGPLRQTSQPPYEYRFPKSERKVILASVCQRFP
jgi:hypothetical protein